MKKPLFISTKSMTGRLAMFFVGVSIMVGIFCYAIFSVALNWSEDRVGERRILFDRDQAIERFLAGEKGRIRLDVLTVAYNDLSLVPAVLEKHIEGESYYLGETESRMLYLGEYTDGGVSFPILLESEIDRVEFSVEERVYAIATVISLIALMMFSFGALLYKLSQRLIEPINELTQQLEKSRGEFSQEFEVPDSAAIEFQTLTDELNSYRSEIKSLIKREQAFARYASHELRTPLTVMQGSTKLLFRSEKNEFQERQITRISDATYQMSTMVDALLSLVRYERSKDDAPVRSLKASEIQKIVEQNLAQAMDKKLDFELDIKDGPQVQASEAVLNMVVGNLIRNAIAATNKGKISIEMTPERLSVRDEGNGLTETYDENGHGMGLLIVDHLCRRFSWGFVLENLADGGCEARITF